MHDSRIFSPCVKGKSVSENHNRRQVFRQIRKKEIRKEDKMPNHGYKVHRREKTACIAFYSKMHKQK